MRSSRPVFGTVEIEVATRCNRACSYCPVSVIESPPTARWMDDTTYRRTISELQRIGFDGFLSYHFYSEPLLRKDLEELVGHARSQLPRAFQLLYTNGDFLTHDRYQLLRAAGVDHIIVTQHDDRDFPQRPSQTVVKGSELILTNRGGLIEGVEGSQEARSAPCHAPTDQLMVTHNGDVLLCCDDAERQNVMGNINRSSIESIWFSSEFARLRRRLAEGRRSEAGAICAECSNMEYVKQGENYYCHLREI